MRARRPWAVVGTAAALAFLTGMGVSLMPAAAPRPGASASAPETRVAGNGGSGVLATLARAQQPGDRPRIPVGARLTPSTFRILDHGALADLYAARDTSHRICLVAVTIDDQFAAACDQDPERLSAPLRLRFTVASPGAAGPAQLVAGLPATR